MQINITKVEHFSGHKATIFIMGKALRDGAFYTGGSDGFVAEWHLGKSKDGKLIVNVGKAVYSLLINQAGQQLLCGTAEGNIHVIALSTLQNDLVSGEELRNISAHTAGVFDIKTTGQIMITAGGDGIINIWNIDTLHLLKTIHASDKSARTIAVNPDQKTFAVGFSDWSIRVYGTQTLDLIYQLKGHSNSVFALAYSPDGRYLLSSGRDAMLKAWDVNNNYNLTKDIPAHTMQVKSIAFTPSGKLFATASMDKTIKIWNAETFELLKVVDRARNESHINCINKVMWLNETILLSCSDDKTAIAWSIHTE